VSSNRFEVLKVRVMQKGEGSSKETTKDRREILREEKAKRGVEVRQTKVERKEKKEKKRSGSEDWVKARGGRERSGDRSIVG